MSWNRTITRRQSIAAAGTAAGAAALGGTAAAGEPVDRPAAAEPVGRPSAGEVRAGHRAFIAVSAATVWVEPGLERPQDAPSLANPVDMDEWNASMEDTEARRWLVGKLETAAVLGSEVIVDEVAGEWARIVVTHQGTPRDARGYPGWVPVRQLVVDEPFARAAATRPVAVVTAFRTVLRPTPAPGGAPGRGGGLDASFNTELPVLGRVRDLVKVQVPGAKPMYVPASDVVVRGQGEKPPVPTAEDIIATGAMMLGLRYLWGGVSAYGYDCSGFTFSIFRHHGIAMHRDAGPQLTDSGFEPVDRADLEPGDLLFWSTKPGSDSIRHVAMYIGNDQMMQAPNSERSVEVTDFPRDGMEDDWAGAVRVQALRR